MGITPLEMDKQVIYILCPCQSPGKSSPLLLPKMWCGQGGGCSVVESNICCLYPSMAMRWVWQLFCTPYCSFSLSLLYFFSFFNLPPFSFGLPFSMEKTIFILAGPQLGKSGWYILRFWWKKTLEKFLALQYTNKSLNLLESKIIGCLELLNFCWDLHFWTKL